MAKKTRLELDEEKHEQNIKQQKQQIKFNDPAEVSVLKEEEKIYVPRIMKAIFKKPWRNVEMNRQYEQNTKPSETRPGQDMTIDELIDRHTRGLPLSGNRMPIYNEDLEIPDLEKMDLAEIEQLSENVKAVILEGRTKQEELRKKEEAEKLRLEKLREFQAWKEQEEKNAKGGKDDSK